MSLLTMPLCNLALEWAHITLRLDERGWTLRGGGAGRGESSEKLPVQHQAAARRRGTTLQEAGHSWTRTGSNAPWASPLPLTPQGRHPARPGHPCGLTLLLKASKSLSLLCCSPKPSSTLGVKEPLFFSLARGKHSTSAIAWKRCQTCSAAGWLQQMQCKDNISNMFVEYLSLFSNMCSGNGLFPWPASPRGSQGCTSTENKESHLLWGFWCGMKMQAASDVSERGKERRGEKPRDSTGCHDRPCSGKTAWLSTTFSKSGSA